LIARYRHAINKVNLTTTFDSHEYPIRTAPYQRSYFAYRLTRYTFRLLACRVGTVVLRGVLCAETPAAPQAQNRNFSRALFSTAAPTSIYLSYSHNPNRAYLDQWVKSSIRRGYVDPCGTQIRLIFPIFEYCFDCSKKSSADPLNSFNHFRVRVRPWKSFSFYLFFLGTEPAGIYATHTLPHSSLQLLSRGGASQTRMLPHGPSSFHSYTIVTSVRRRDETKRHKAMSA
jgi:hypothetical protein